MNRTLPVFAAFAAISAISIVVGSWTPFQFQSGRLAEIWPLFLQQGFSRDLSRSDVVANFWLGFPLVIGLSGLIRVHTGTVLRRLFWILVILVAQVFLSLIAEVGQGWFAGRTTSLSDFVLQIAGALTATVLWQWLGRWVDAKMNLVFVHPAGKQKWNGLDAVLTLAATGVLIWTVMPLDIMVSPADLVKELLKTELVPFTQLEASWSENAYQWFASFLIAIPLGLWLSRRLAKHFSGRFSLISIVMIAIATGILPEVAQFPIDSRVATATDALFGALGALTGILIGSQFASTRFSWAKQGFRESLRSPGLWFALAMVQALVVCAVAWMPFDFASEASVIADRLKQLRGNPFSGLGGSDLLNGLTMFRQAALGGVMGAFLGLTVRYLRLGKSYSVIGVILIVVLMIAFSAGVELVQLVVNSRSGEAIGTFIRSAGSILGLVIAMTLSTRD